tara:strand:- start:9990 stop:11090 length:1101 start_codon:yes stop_codon:yes gene_type:complete
MKQFVFVVFSVFHFFGFSQDYQFTIQGSFPANANQSGSVSHWDVDHRKTVFSDSIHIDKEGELHAIIHQEPGLYVVKFNGLGAVNIAVDNLQTITIEKAEKGLTAHGTHDLELLAAYETFRKASLAKWLNQVRAEIRIAKKEQDTNEVKSLSLLENKNYLAHRNELTHWVEQNMGTSIAVYATSTRWTVTDLAYMNAMLPQFKQAHPNLKITEALVQKVDRFNQISVGAEAVEITAKDTAGQSISLSSFRGNYVLIDFWASWCGPCRRENGELRKIYKAYASLGFEIFGVSLDKKPARWKQAIRQDGLPWTQVSELDGYLGEAPFTYNITAIPSNVLINPQGVIIGYNLFGTELHDKLQELLGNAH